MPRFNLIDKDARELIIRQVQERGYCPLSYGGGGEGRDFYMTWPSGSTHTLVSVHSCNGDVDLFERTVEQIRELERIAERRRGEIVQALIDGFEKLLAEVQKDE